MQTKKKILIIIMSLFLLTGCTKYLKDDNNKTIINKETGQSLTENILCKPTNENTIKIYEENGKNLDKLNTCNEFKINDGGYEGLWTSIFVKPLAWLILKIGKIVKNNGLAIIITTLLIRLFVYPATKKTAIQSENIKKAKPELDKLEKKYANKVDKESQMQKAQEMMIIYKKYEISPASGCLLSFIQLPLFFAFLEAINRVPAIFEDTFLSLQMGTTPSIGIGHGNYYYIILIILIIGTTYFSFKHTLKDQSNPGVGQMKFTIYFMLFFIAIASINLPTASAIYWITSSAFTIIKNEIVKRKKV